MSCKPSYRLQMIGKCPKVGSLSKCCIIAGSLQNVLFGRKIIRVLTVNAKLAFYLHLLRAMVSNHEQDAPPARTLVF